MKAEINLVEEAKNIIEFAASEYEYQPAVNWNQEAQFMPSDANIAQNLYLEFCLLKSWLRETFKINATEHFNGNQWEPKVEVMEEGKELEVTDLYENPLPSLIEAVRIALNYIENKRVDTLLALVNENENN